MLVHPTYPGVYIQEIPSGVNTITGVSTSVTAFVGRTLRGPTDQPTTINSFADFQRIFGGLWANNLLGYAVRDFFINGGNQAIIVRIMNDVDTQTATSFTPLHLASKKSGAAGNTIKYSFSVVPALAASSSAPLQLQAKTAGAAGNNISYSITASTGTTFTLTIKNTPPVALIPYPNLTPDTISAALANSELITLLIPPTEVPDDTISDISLQGGSDIKVTLSITDTSVNPPKVEPFTDLTPGNFTAKLATSTLVDVITPPVTLPIASTGDYFLIGGIDQAKPSVSTLMASSVLPLSLVSKKQGAAGNNIKYLLAVVAPITASSITPLNLRAKIAGAAGNNIKYSIKNRSANQFDLHIMDTSTNAATTLEDYYALNPSTITQVITSQSNLVTLVTAPAIVPDNTTSDIFLQNGSDEIVTLKVTDTNVTPAKEESITDLTIRNFKTKLLKESTLVTPITAPSSFTTTRSDVFLSGGNDLSLIAANYGAWGNNLQVSASISAPSDIADIALSYGLTPNDLFNLTITDSSTGTVEQFNNLSIKDSPGKIDQVLLNRSTLVKVNPQQPLPSTTPTTTPNPSTLADGSNGLSLTVTNILGDQAKKTGLYLLEKTDIFNLLCIPGYNASFDLDAEVMTHAAAYCYQRNAFFVIDSPSNWTSVETAKTGMATLINLVGSNNANNCAVFFPRILQQDPLKNNQVSPFVPCGMIAGTMATIDAQRGVWKSPAGIEASLSGVTGLQVPLTNAENGELNPIAVNCLRTMPASGTVIWGSRTLQGNDLLASDWKYIPVRRMALYLEQSIYQSTKWAVFEPNDAALWRQLSLNINTFMNNLFRQGAFQGQTTASAYFVKCDNETTTQYDIVNGIVNIQIGFAPLKPAEFVIISIQQISGQNQS